MQVRGGGAWLVVEGGEKTHGCAVTMLEAVGAGYEVGEVGVVFLRF